jgi:hypothetical protein
MYGLVNKAIEDLVVSEHGQDAWERICKSVGFHDSTFVAMQPYDDAITYSLVGAISEELGADPNDVLRSFGKWWITYTAKEGYGEMLSMYGDNLATFLDNLGDMHDRVALTFPELVPPRFEVEALQQDVYQLDYHSERDALAAMVLGLLDGLAERFDTQLEVEQIHTRAEQGFDRYLVKELRAG